jgi:hypothetical protein
MKRGLEISTVTVLAFVSGIAVSFFTLPLWITVLVNAAREGNRADWLGFAGGLIGNILTGAVAAVAIVVAWRGIKHQLRISLISREEERIERVLPGLKEVVGYIIDLRKRFRTITAHSVLKHIEQFNDYDPTKDRLDDKLKLRVPSADEGTRQRLLLAIETIWDYAMAADAQYETLSRLQQRPEYRAEIEAEVFGEARGKVGAAETSRNMRMLVLLTAVTNLRDLENDLVAQIDKYELRLPKFRSELETFFDD